MYLLYCTRTFRLMFGPLKYIGRAALEKKKRKHFTDTNIKNGIYDQTKD